MGIAKQAYLGGAPPIMPLWGGGSGGQEVGVLKGEEREIVILETDRKGC